MHIVLHTDGKRHLFVSVLQNRDCRLWTADYGLSINHGLRYKTWTKHYGLNIKHGLQTVDCRLRTEYKPRACLGYKTWTKHYGLNIKHGLNAAYRLLKPLYLKPHLEVPTKLYHPRDYTMPCKQQYMV